MKFGSQTSKLCNDKNKILLISKTSIAVTQGVSAPNLLYRST